MKTLKWTKRSAGRWTLKDEFGSIWAVVVPYCAEHACKNQHKALILDSESQYRGKLDWTTGIGVAPAKRAAERMLINKSCAFENFQFAA